MGRTVRQATYHDADFQHETFTSYGPNTVHVDPPGNTSPATWTTTDALGRVTEIEQYTDADQSTTRSTRYAYDVRGNRSEITDPAGNKWTYKYDVRNRIVEATDPDTGTTKTTAYDGADRPLTTVDANGKSLHTTYGVLGRVTAVREGSATARACCESGERSYRLRNRVSFRCCVRSCCPEDFGSVGVGAIVRPVQRGPACALVFAEVGIGAIRQQFPDRCGVSPASSRAQRRALRAGATAFNVRGSPGFHEQAGHFGLSLHRCQVQRSGAVSVPSLRTCSTAQQGLRAPGVT